MHEAKLYEKTSFVTLTYDDKKQKALSLDKRHLQLFMKSLRRKTPKLKFFACGEYGDKLGRPHYHLALFGEDFRQDRYIWRNEKGNTLYRSPLLEQAWKRGNSEIGNLTQESAMYIASYVTKKITGPRAHWHYRKLDEHGNEYWLEPEFSLMSRGGRKGRGLGHAWLMKYHTDVYPEDLVVTNKGHKAKPPRYYDNLIEQIAPETSALIKFRREMRAKQLAGDNTPARLADKETVTIAKQALKKRNLENP